MRLRMTGIAPALLTAVVVAAVLTPSARAAQDGTRAMVSSAFDEAIGRTPTDGELDTWVRKVKASSASHDAAVGMIVEWLASRDGENELTFMVGRAFQRAKGHEPNKGEVESWKQRVRSGKLSFKALVQAMKG